MHLFLWNTSLTKKIDEYGFLDYAVNEALFLSDKEEIIVMQIIGNIRQEYNHNMGKFSHNTIITQLESLLNYSDRFYQGQLLKRENQSLKLDA